MSITVKPSLHLWLKVRHCFLKALFMLDVIVVSKAVSSVIWQTSCILRSNFSLNVPWHVAPELINPHIQFVSKRQIYFRLSCAFMSLVWHSDCKRPISFSLFSVERDSWFKDKVKNKFSVVSFWNQKLQQPIYAAPIFSLV